MSEFILEKEEYEVFCEKYRKLGSNVVPSLKDLLKEIEVGFLDVSYRIKTYDSFQEKVDRKNYSNPLTDNEDFCGIRIICYFPSDIEKIAKKISEEFIVHSSEDKSEMEINTFGYRSYHFVVSLKPEWTTTPSWRGLDNIKVELQVRTILMHAWADIEHKLQYKRAEHVPKDVRRKFYQLSALFELADEQLNEIRNKSEEMKEKIYEVVAEGSNDTLEQLEMNIDTLKAFMDKYFPGEYYESATLELLDDLLFFNIDFKYLYSLYKKRLYVLEAFRLTKKEEVTSSVGKIQKLLCVYHDNYWNAKKEDYRESEIEYFEELKERFGEVTKEFGE